MLQSLIHNVRRVTPQLAAAGSLVVLFAGPLAAMPPLPPDDPRDARVGPPDPDPFVVVMSDADRPAAAAEPGARAPRAATPRAQPARSCKRVRVTVVRPDGSVETRLVSQRGRQPAPSGD